MRDRGAIIAIGVVLLACAIAGVGYLFLTVNEARQEAVMQAEMARVEAQEAREVHGEGVIPPRLANRTFNKAQLDESLASAIQYLRKQQSPDGMWRSDQYATFKDGTALTPLVLDAIRQAEEHSQLKFRDAESDTRGLEQLIKLIKPDGTLVASEASLEYPVYTAALSLQVIVHYEKVGLTRATVNDKGEIVPLVTKEVLKVAREGWVKFLLDRQLTEKNGWKPEDKQYGGWGYFRFVPQKPKPGDIGPTSLLESNLSATMFALEALHVAGVKDVNVYRAARDFVLRCRSGGGGFHFIYDDPVRNKAGLYEDGQYRSYGSATADAVRALQIIGSLRDKNDENTKQFASIDALGGLNWLQGHFKPDLHPGEYIAAHEPNREAVYYYYAASVSKAFRKAKVKTAGRQPWAEALADELTKRQRQDGSWANPVTLVREDEPLVATANAVIALANCKAAMAGK